MEKLATTKRAAILRCLIEGNSILSTSRITGAAKNTIVGVLVETGEACDRYQNDHMVNLPCKVLQLDEVWSFVGCKENNKKFAKGEHPGDTWIWTALCADTKLIPSWQVGDRSALTAYGFCQDLAKRFSGHLQITSDGHSAYRWAVGAHFPGADFAQLVKLYGRDKNGLEVCIGARKVPVRGTPDMRLVSTSYVERSNLMIRMTNRRFTRLTNGFSKKLENHGHMLAVQMMSYNFVQRHSTLKTSPAVAAGVADHRWTMEEIIEMTDSYTAEIERQTFERAFAAKFS